MHRIVDWLAQRSFRLQLIGAAVASEIVLIAVLTYLGVQQMDRALTEQIKVRIDQGSILFNATLAPDLVERDFTALELTLKLARNEGAVEYAILHDERGKPIVTVGWDKERPLPVVDSDVRKAADSGMVHLQQSILLGDQVVGELRYGLPTAFLREARNTLLRQTIAVASAGILISLVGLLLLGFGMMRRLGSLANVARQLADGDLTVRVGNHSNDEIGRLGAAFNNMAQALDDRIHELHASEDRLALVMRGTTDGIWDWDILRNVTYFSPRFRELLGYDDEQEFRLMFQFSSALHPDDSDHALAAMDAAKLRHARFDETYRLRCRDGSYRWFRGRGQAQWDEGGVAYRFAGSLSDISAQKAAEEALRESEETLFYAVRGSSDGIWDWDIVHNRYYVSPRYRELLGYSEEDMPNARTSFLEIVHPEDRPRIEEAVRQHFRERTPYDIEYRMRLKNGSYRWFRGRGQAVWNADGRAIRFAGASSDIEAEKIAADSIRSLLAEQQALLDNVLVGIVYLKNRIIQRCNRRFEELFGYEEGSMLGHTTELVFPAREDFEAHGARAYAALGRGETYSVETRFRRKDGSLFWGFLTGRAIDPAHPQGGSVWINLDITDRKLAEAEVRKLNEELEQRVRERTAELTAANKELEAFSYSVSHDLVSPLRAIDGFSRMIEEDYEPLLDARGKEYIGRIRNGTQRMHQLIDDMLALSRVTRNEMKRVSVNLSGIASTILSDMKQMQPVREVTTRIALDIGVIGDPNLLRIALENLLRNAWKFTAKKPAIIEFGALHEENETVYFVRDNGAGFDMKYAGKLFGAFQRMHGPQEFEGTGIGLAIVQRIIQRHGGRIWAEAVPDQGATFFFTLS
ncbi:MAG: PAS domain-containing protein [Rhodocyclaceae bacterium]|nr:PAS domain-containing protein [Rhodocyclaceae bacterium]